MTTDSFVIRCLHSARRGMGGVLYVALEWLMRLFTQGGVALCIVWTAGAVFDSPLPNRDIALYAACFWAFGGTARCFFSAICQLAQWRTFEQAGEGAVSRGPWLRDLPAVMAIDALADIGRTVATIGAAISLATLVLRQSFACVPCLAILLLAIVVIDYMRPAVTAERLVHGPGLTQAIARAVSTFANHPLRSLAVCAIPGIASASLFGLGIVLTVFGKTGLAALSMTAGIALRLARPVFWCELARG